MRSMTGFGSAVGQLDGMTVSVELRTLNHRFFTLRVNVPEGLSVYEPEVEKLMRSSVSRGTVTVTVNVANARGSRAVDIDVDFVKQLFHQFTALKKTVGSKEPLSFEALLQLPLLWQEGSHSSERARRE